MTSSNDAEMEWKTEIATILQSGLLESYKREILADVSVKVEGQIFPCHRVVLAAMSPYFRAMFSGGFREGHQSEVVLKEISCQMFEKVLDYIYGKQNPVIISNVHEMTRVACMLQIQPLQTKCETLMINNLSTDNCVNYWQYARYFLCENLQKKAKDFILQNFDLVVTSSDFLILEQNELTELIRDDNLKVAREEKIADGVLSWLRHSEERKQNVSDLFEHIRFPLMESEYLFNITRQNQWIIQDAECMKMLEEAKEYQLVGGRRHDISSKRTQYRKCSSCYNALIGFSISSSSSGTNHHVRMDAYSFHDKKMKFLCWAPVIEGTYFAACTYFDDIFISGGINNVNNPMNEFHKYVVSQQRWIALRKLPEVVYGHAMLPVGGSLFTFGGRNQTEVLPRIHQYDTTRKSWKEVGSLCVPVWDISCKTAVLAGKVYVCGGKTDILRSESCTNSYVVQCYDNQTNQCTVIIRLSKSMEVTSAFTSGDTIYLNTQDKKDFSFAKIECSQQPGDDTTIYSIQILRNVLNKLNYLINIQAAFLYDSKWFLNVKCCRKQEDGMGANARRYQILCTVGELTFVEDSIRKFHVLPLFKYSYAEGVPLLRTVLPK